MTNRSWLISSLVTTAFLFSLHALGDRISKDIGETLKDDAAHIRTSEDIAKTARQNAKSELTDEVAKLGGNLFVKLPDEAQRAQGFKEFLEPETGYARKYDGKDFTQALDVVVPRKQKDGSLKPTTARDELPLAKFIARMMVTLGDDSWSKGYDIVSALHEKYKKTPDSDVSKEAFAERLMVAFKNWGKDKETGKDVDNKPAEEWLQSFYTAFKQAKKEAVKFKEDQDKLIADAAGGNKDAYDKLVGDKTNKDPNAAANKFALGKDMPQVIAQLYKDGNDARALELVQALSKPNKGHFYVNNGEGKPIIQEVPEKPEAIKAIFTDPEKMGKAQFVGAEHPQTSFPITWAWNTETKKNDVKPGVAPPTAGQQQQVAAAQPQQQQQVSPDAPAALSGSQVWTQRCQHCHRDGPYSASMAQRAIDVGTASGKRMPMGGTLTKQERDNLLKWLSERGAV